MNLSQALAEKDRLVARCEATLDHADRDGRILTASEKTAYDADVNRISEINGMIDHDELDMPPRSRGVRTSLGDPDPTIAAQRALNAPIAPLGNSNFDSSIISAPMPGALKAFANTRQGHADAFRSGQWVRATLLQDPKAYAWCTAHGLQPDIRAAGRESVNTLGGATVVDELSNVIIRLVETFGRYRANSRVIAMSSDHMSIARRKGGLTAAFVGEGVEGDESDVAWDSIGLTPKKVFILSKLSTELSEDSIISMTDLLALECALAISSLEDGCGFVGDGSSTYGGMRGITYRFEHESLKGGISATAPHDTLAEVDADDLLNVLGTLPEYALPGAKWYCSQMCFAQVLAAIAMGAGGVSMQEMQAGMGPRFWGFPVVVTSKLPSTGTLDAKVVLLFGDLSMASTMGVRRELRFQVSNERYFETDEIAIKCTSRFDINNHDLGDANTAGPVVCLLGNTA